MKYYTIETFFDKVPAVKQGYVAQLAGISPQQMSDFVRGWRKPSAEQLEALNKALWELHMQLAVVRIK